MCGSADRLKGVATRLAKLSTWLMTWASSTPRVASCAGHLSGVPRRWDRCKNAGAGAKKHGSGVKEVCVSFLWLSLVLAVGAYLLYALLNPERF